MVVQNAATAARTAKSSPGSAYCFFDASMNQKAERRYQLERLMRGALERGEFQLHYQPKRCLRTGAIAGAEALFRWKNDELGFVSPAEAIPVAEETGMILEIGRWVVQTACAQTHAWRSAGIALPNVSVNASIRQFREPGFAVQVQRVLLETGLPAEVLEVEVTESFLADNASAVVMELEALRRAGVRVAIDDFGTGFSSLGYLRHLPFDVLKIDRAFVVDIADDPRSAALMASVLEMARALGKETVVEGVETQPQLDLLTAQGWDYIQGYVFSKPLPVPDFEALVRSHGTR
jgi:EAL domain-containing protein (putative c-di-GMP-specific phosphodiesterase class I)